MGTTKALRMKLPLPSRSWLAFPFVPAWLLGICLAVPVRPAPPATAPATQPLAELKPVPLLAGRPDADPNTELLGSPYDNKIAGISFRPPADCKQVATPNADEIVEFNNEKTSWLLRVSKPTFPSPVPLTTVKDPKTGRETVGILDYTLQQIVTATPGAKVLRGRDHDVINVESNFVGMIAVRFTLGTQRWLRQQALVQGNDQLYYIFNLTTPAGKINPGDDEEKLPPDPLEISAVRTFNAMVDSIRVIDRTPIKEDQNQRLFRTRALFLYWTQKKFDAIKVEKQYLRILVDGKDAGYSYVEEMNNDPKLLTGVDGEGAVVYARTHRIEKDDKGHEQQVDVGSFNFMSFDRRKERWTRILVLQRNGLEGVEETHTTEYAEGNWETKMMFLADGGVLPREERANGKAPPMRPADSHTLDVSMTGKGGNPEPMHLELPPFYLPAAGEHLLPRLVVEKAYHEPRTYLFACYVPQTKDIRLKYVDVSYERDVTFAGKRLRAISVMERLGLEGSPTIHYVTADGKYLGSETKSTGTLILPSDEASILKLWPDAKLTRPDKMRRESAGPALGEARPGNP
jgi:hypothetical protein